MKKIIIYLLFFLFLFSCKQTNKVESAITPSMEDSTVVKSDTAFALYDIVDRNVPIQGIVYLKRDVDAMSAPTDAAEKKLTSYSRLQLCSVIGEKDDWYAVLDSVTANQIFKPEEQYIGTIYRKLYIKKNATASISDYKLKDSDFSLVSYIDSDGNEIVENISSQIMTFDLIEQSEFEVNKKNAIDFVKHDTIAIRKIDGVIKLPCKNKVLELKDERGSDSEPEKTNIYTYVGYSELFNAYMVYTEFFEEDSYNLYSKDTGQLIHTFNSYPIVSLDKKYVADLSSNSFDLTTDLSLYKVNNNKSIKLTYAFSFRKWAPYSDGLNYKNDYFWGANNNLFVKTINIDISGYTRLGLNEASQYIKINIK